ncbi:hypothetical protein HPP92_011737 [Vanilla planifolia]|uniref:Uncharacterized protein n=1 Tax=Vanilla planifolia TaxID=51239 RepID=A0A835V3S7_VANPL|nr:hypothetical protein HPP92_011737 [Vanilla planifolia]
MEDYHSVASALLPSSLPSFPFSPSHVPLQRCGGPVTANARSTSSVSLNPSPGGEKPRRRKKWVQSRPSSTVTGAHPAPPPPSPMINSLAWNVGGGEKQRHHWRTQRLISSFSIGVLIIRSLSSMAAKSSNAP